jgi:diguanylate cyclase (GGDEF)-like protein/PAS domain S-box-containing protein
VRNAEGKIIATASIVRDVTAIRRAEQAIASLASIVESAGDAIFSLTPDGIFLTWNQGAEILWGYSATEILGNHICILVKPDRYAEQREVMESIRCAQRVSNLETVTWTKDGHAVDVSVSVSPIRNAAGDVVGSSTIGRNISRQKRAEEALRRSEEKYRSLVSNLPDLVWTATENGRVTFSSGGWPGAQKFVAKEVVHPGSFLKVIHPDDLQSVQTAFRELFVNRKPMDVEFRSKREDGSWAWLHNRSFATYEKEGIRYADGILSDLSERKRMEERLAYQATHDALTDLPSRSFFEELLQRTISHARRKGNSVALLHVDLDRFRVVNDTLGHAIGDVLLQQISRRLIACLRESEVPSRTGGDNFSVILPELEDPQTVCAVAQRIIDALSKPFDIRGTEVFLSVTVGVALFPQDGDNIVTLQQSADSAMQLAKKLGRNRFQMFTVDMQAAPTERLALECELHRALERSEFSVHYQPVFDLETGSIAGAEALLRWHNPRFGQVPPSVFIPIAEESGLILPIGAWVLQQACHQVRLWRVAGFGPLTVAVNFSAAQFTYGNLVPLIAHALKEAGVDGANLVVEVTESVIMQDAKDSARQLAAIQKLGVTVSLDDFGTGYSSLSYLGDLPINSLKIDRSFIQRLDDASRSATLIQAIGALAHSLALHTIAEGVETQRQLDLVRSMGCDFVQGYFLAKPGPPEAITALLAQRASLHPIAILPTVSHPASLIQ